MVYKKSKFLWQVTNLRGGEWNSSELGEVLWCSSRRLTAEEQTLLSYVTAPFAVCEWRYITASEVQNILRGTTGEKFFFII